MPTSTLSLDPAVHPALKRLNDKLEAMNLCGLEASSVLLGYQLSREINDALFGQYSPLPPETEFRGLPVYTAFHTAAGIEVGI